ncbi:MAG: hypothetical protein AAF734_04450 [Bacteroidota bacterium]
MKLKEILLCIVCALMVQACHQKARCPAYMEVGAISVAEGGTYDPTQAGYIQVERSVKTGLVKRRKKPSSKKKIAKQKKTDKGFYKDPNMFYDEKSKPQKKKKFLGIF